MKKRIFILLISAFVLLSVHCYANENGYLVKFKEGFKPDINLELINERENLYLSKTNIFNEEIKNNIEYIEENIEVSLPEDNYAFAPKNGLMLFSSNEGYHMDLIKSQAFWTKFAFGEDIKVGVIDSGCYAHPDLEGNLLPGKNYIDGTTNTSDEKGHGTHVSGMIAGLMNNFGITGIAPKAKIVPLKCFSTGSSSLNYIVSAIYDAVDVYGCKVINMSFGSSGTNVSFEKAIKYAYDKNVILVSSVGNDGTISKYYPAAYPQTIGVGSVSSDKSKSTFSQYNSTVDVVAPGEKIKSTYLNGAYAQMSGTSQAAPCVTAIAALALSVDSTITPSRFKQLLIDTSEDLGTVGRDDKFGYGLVDADKILQTVLDDVKAYISKPYTSGNNTSIYVKNNTNNLIPMTADFENNNSTYTFDFSVPKKCGMLISSDYSKNVSANIFNATENETNEKINLCALIDTPKSIKTIIFANNEYIINDIDSTNNRIDFNNDTLSNIKIYSLENLNSIKPINDYISLNFTKLSN